MTPFKVSPLQLFTSPLQYVVPLFQRSYVWTIKGQIRNLWLDVVDRADALEGYLDAESRIQGAKGAQSVVKPPSHFLGTIIITAHTSPGPGYVTTADVIDGQQRITTLQLLLLAFRDAVQDLPDEFARSSLEKYTWNQDSYREKSFHYKLWPTNAGRQEISSLVDARSFRRACDEHPIVEQKRGRRWTRTQRSLMVQTYIYLYGMISLFLRGVDPTEPAQETDDLEYLLIDVQDQGEGRANVSHQWQHELQIRTHPVLPYGDRPMLPERAELLRQTLADYFQLIDLRLDSSDDAQVIFETLNARGERLTPADLVRNFVFLTATKKGEENINDLYEQYWKQYDERPSAPGDSTKKAGFWKQEERQGRLMNTRLDVLMYHYVSSQSDHEIMLAHVFEGFKVWWAAADRKTGEELAKLKQASDTFAAMVAPDRSTPFGQFAYRIRVLDSSTLTPVVLYLREQLGQDDPDFLRSIEAMESYLIRRSVCGLTTKAYNRIFPGLLQVLRDKGRKSETVVDYLSGLNGPTQAWPTNEEFQQAWDTKPAYLTLRAGKARMILEAIELGLRDPQIHELEGVPTDLQIEHVLPQSWGIELEGWPLPPTDTPDLAVQLRRAALHTFGNLTLVRGKLNNQLSNSPFVKKREKITESMLCLNAHFLRPKYLGEDAVWDEGEINARGKEMFATALKLWPGPRQVVGSGD